MNEFSTIDLAEAERQQNRKRSMRRYWIFFGTAGVFVLLGLISLYYRTQSVSATKISDTTFVSKANAVCTTYLPPLINKQPQKDEDIKTPEIVKRVEETANGMQNIRTRIAAIPVATADQAAVNAWLASWDRYVDAGHRYATALKKSDKAAYTIGNASSADSAKITAFAIVNHISRCELRTQESSSIM